jgi:molybdopterin/thiamine biosynthesis adenylyltransferase
MVSLSWLSSFYCTLLESRLLSAADNLSRTNTELPELSEHEQAVYEWQSWVPGLGELGQRKLKATSVMISRLGGIGGTVAYQLAAAGIGKLVLAHAGNVTPSDLNRQLLMTHDWIGKPRMQSARRRLHELNPRVEIVGVEENVSESNAFKLVSQADIVVDCAPLFPERFAMNAAAVAQRKPMVECAMYELESQITTIWPGTTPCLSCFVPEAPPTWKRQFPVIGAVSGAIACLAAMEVIKLVTGIGEPLLNRMLRLDLRSMTTNELLLNRRQDCITCGHLK